MAGQSGRRVVVVVVVVVVVLNSKPIYHPHSRFKNPYESRMKLVSCFVVGPGVWCRKGPEIRDT